MTSALQTIISRPKTVLTLMVFMIAAGIMSYISVPKEANPDIDVPIYYVSIGQQGISPRDAERLLIRPMETSLRGIDGLKELTAIASEGHAGIVLEFNIETDSDQVLADVRDKVDEAKAELPDEADEPTITETNFALQPTIIVTLSGDVPERTLTTHARRLKDEIEAISSVREASLGGNREELLEVVLDLMKMESYDITQDELLNALTQNNQLVAAGFIDDGNGRFNVKVPGLVETAQDVYEIPIKQSGEGVVTLGEVAEIRRTYKDPSAFTRVNGQPAIAIEVTKRIGTNIIENNDEVRAVVQDFTKDWPQSIKVNYLLDQSSFIFEVLGSLQSSIMTAIVLVMISVVGTLGVRSGLLVGLAIPGSFMLAFLILAGLGMTVNMMVMFGMVLTVGMLVDGAIVVTEYADRKISEGMNAADAYKRASKLMFWPVVSSTATTLAAFLPLLLWPGVPGEFMSYLPRMVIIVLTASLLTALVFLPVTGTAFARIAAFAARNSQRTTGLFVGAIAGVFAYAAPLAGLDASLRLGGALGTALLAFALSYYATGFINSRRESKPAEEDQADEVALMLSSRAELDVKKVPGITGGYLRFLRYAAGTLWGNILVIVVILGMTVASFMFFAANNKGVEFFVDEEPDVAIVMVSARGNMSAAEIRDLVGEVEAEVLQVQGIDNVVMSASAAGGGGPDVLGGVQDKPADVVGELQIELADYCCRRKAVEIFEDIRQRTADMAGIKVEVRKIEGGPPTGKDLQLEVKSTDYDTMVAAVDRIRAFVDTVDILSDQEDGRPLPGIEWQIDVDREQAGRYNAGIVGVGSMVQLVTNGVLIGTYRPNDSEDEVDIRVRLPEDQRTLDQFELLKLRTANGQVPLSNFIERTPQPKVSSITRRDGLYAMDVKASVADGATVDGRAATPDDAVREVQAWLDTQEWPENVFLKFRGADEEQQESSAFLGRAAIAALFMMFIILLTQFNSFYQTVLTLSTVILAVSGVLVGMAVTGQRFSIIMTGTGIVALAGIVVNNAIVLIDTFNRMRAEGVTDIRQAALKTAAQRLRPIMLTTITTILGLIPMALQINMNFFTQTISVGGITSIWWVQLSTAIIFGLAFSTMLTLVLIPSMLALPTNVRDLWGGKAKRVEDGTRAEPEGSENKTVAADDEEQHKRADNDDLPVTRPDAAE
ncbi:efflux RND transporter permease subunit [Hoeflea poritis]|uniref:Efflux RND transporter permease subunit n=1 Tax=Hoeflea poritis TaxID=2993659 RepID=A0ABT4VQF1_9HYPH|nr:efflux RND transporter permease subunit [Hoeflea poritis]MDA4846936.1 efflux RND transporter permease subunit [Hoeflea poritis]